MQIEKISASAAKTYEGCEMQYYLDYVLKWRFPAGKAANVGTVTHKILEILGKISQAQKSGKNFNNDTFTTREIINYILNRASADTS